MKFYLVGCSYGYHEDEELDCLDFCDEIFAFSEKKKAIWFLKNVVTFGEFFEEEENSLRELLDKFDREECPDDEDILDRIDNSTEYLYTVSGIVNYGKKEERYKPYLSEVWISGPIIPSVTLEEGEFEAKVVAKTKKEAIEIAKPLIKEYYDECETGWLSPGATVEFTENWKEELRFYVSAHRTKESCSLMTPQQREDNIKILFDFKINNPVEYDKLVFSEDSVRAFFCLESPPDIRGVNHEQELILLLTEVELLWSKINKKEEIL